MIFYEDDETVQDLRLKTQEFLDDDGQQQTEEEIEQEMTVGIKFKKTNKTDKAVEQLREPVINILHRPLLQKMHLFISKHRSFLSNSFSCSRNGMTLLYAEKCGLLSSQWTVIDRQDGTTLGKIVKNHDVYSINQENRRLAALKIDQQRISAILPVVRNSQISFIQANQMSDLFTLNKISTHKDNLTVLHNLKVQGTVHHDLYQRLGFMRSKRNFVLRQPKSDIDLKIFLGKVKQDEFKLSVAENISIFQAFCMAVCWLD